MLSKRSFLLPLFTIASCLALSQCGPENKFSPPPPVPVTVAKPIVSDMTVYVDFPASLTGVAEVEIRARVKGILEKMHFTEGSMIKQNADLYLIEQAPYIAAVASAKANVAKSQAAFKLATANLARYEKAGPRAVSALDIETAKAEVDNAKAEVAQTNAMLEDAEISLSYTTIKAPINGRIARTLEDLGNLVGDGQASLLTSIVDESSVRAYFEVPERQVLEYYRRRSEHKSIEGKLPQVRLELADGSIYEHLGVIDYIDNKVNESTRTSEVRATFPNPDSKLSSGLFARVGYPRQHPSAIMVPSTAILKDIGGSYVWVVDANNIVHRRGIVTGPIVLREQKAPKAAPIRDIIVSKGLSAEDNVIIKGLQRAREGAKVDAKPAAAISKPEQPAELHPKQAAGK